LALVAMEGEILPTQKAETATIPYLALLLQRVAVAADQLEM
jgi:hypothetical protein